LFFFEGEIVTLLRREWVFKLFHKELLKPNRVEKRIKFAFLSKVENLSRGFETIFLWNRDSFAKDETF
jgi:hypothetical protein